MNGGMGHREHKCLQCVRREEAEEDDRRGRNFRN